MGFNLPISVKGIIIFNDQVILLKNERNEWELPGGRLERGETAEECLLREIQEELGLTCSIEKLLDVWVYEVLKDKEVFIVTYLCTCLDPSYIVLSSEHVEYQWFPLSNVNDIHMPTGYKNSISKVESPKKSLYL